MDTSPLEAAYTAARKADKATMAGEFQKASTLHKTASDKFKQAIHTTSSQEAKRTLDVLSKQHLSRSKFLLDKKNLTINNNKNKNININNKKEENISSELASSLASARGVSNNNSNNTANSMMSSTPANNLNDDPYFRFYNNMNNLFMRAYNQALHEKERGLQQSVYGGGGGGGVAQTNQSMLQDPTESFYVVPNTTNLNTEELITENSSLRAMINKTSLQLHAYEQATQKHKDAFKAQLVNLKNELAGRELQYRRSVDTELEKANEENEKLRAQLAKYKERWDGLKQSARNKRKDKEESITEE